MRQILLLAWTGSVAWIICGCNGGNPSGEFQTYDQLLTQETKETAVETPETEAMESEPVTAELVRDNDTPTPENTTTATEIPASAIAPLNLVDGTSTGDILNVVKPPSATADTATMPANGAAALPVITVKPGGIQVLVPEKTFKPEGREQALRVSYDDLDLLKVLNMEPVPDDATKYFPEWLQQLHGQKVRVRGFMYPTFESSGIEQFVLARDNQICCFGRDPKVYDLISVTLQPGKATDYIPNRPFDVVGTFHIDLLAEGGKPLGLYWLEDAQVMDR